MTYIYIYLWYNICPIGFYVVFNTTIINLPVTAFMLITVVAKVKKNNLLLTMFILFYTIRLS